MAKKKPIPKKPKYENFSIYTKVLSVENINFPNEKIKTVLECESPTGTPRRCIYWQFSANPTICNVGDRVLLTGRLENGVFLVWKLLRILNPNSERRENGEQ